MLSYARHSFLTRVVLMVYDARNISTAQPVPRERNVL